MEGYQVWVGAANGVCSVKAANGAASILTQVRSPLPFSPFRPFPFYPSVSCFVKWLYDHEFDTDTGFIANKATVVSGSPLSALNKLQRTESLPYKMMRMHHNRVPSSGRPYNKNGSQDGDVGFVAGVGVGLTSHNKSYTRGRGWWQCSSWCFSSKDAAAFNHYCEGSSQVHCEPETFQW
ncbi:hypothetical protein NE237_013420 [Protea cynaroides]|uniref:Uncharacterized protein n=1 Tax=Protea cynaroides TaxID=273540 RepID=A0A9Q0H2Z1_9MAGN|nr:hypothetical protein NE237_013420 [Protea cynaroides]